MEFPRAFLLLAFSLALGLGAARAGNYPDARQAATRVGQEVEFQDVIKAISRSRSKEGCYFSFGAPFPKQVLSVFVSDEVYLQLPRDLGLVGRQVRIKGQLAASSNGPMVTLTSPDIFYLYEVKDEILAKNHLDGALDREQFMAAVAQLFWRDDFATLEQLAKELQESHERFSDGTWIESGFFSALEVTWNEAGERYAEANRKIERWLAQYPGSAVATIVQAGLHVNLIRPRESCWNICT